MMRARENSLRVWLKIANPDQPRSLRCIATIAALILGCLTAYAPSEARAELTIEGNLMSGYATEVRSRARSSSYDDDTRSNRKKSKSSQRFKKAIRQAARESQGSKRAKGVRVAALHPGTVDVSPKPEKITGGVNWLASAGCLDGSLKAVIYQVAATYGPVRVNSTCRSKRHNARVGGVRRSHHLTGDAADFRVSGNVSATYAFLRSHGSVGGLKHYGGGLFHIDTGERRSW